MSTLNAAAAAALQEVAGKRSGRKAHPRRHGCNRLQSSRPRPRNGAWRSNSRSSEPVSFEIDLTQLSLIFQGLSKLRAKAISLGA